MVKPKIADDFAAIRSAMKQESVADDWLILECCVKYVAKINEINGTDYAYADLAEGSRKAVYTALKEVIRLVREYSKNGR